MIHGWIVIDKPVGPGSTQCVAAVKRALREGGYAKARVGHGGTLDPLASGVLPIAVGEATKLAGRLLASDKVYTFTIAFGVETDTLDLEGATVATSDVRPTLDAVAAALPRFTGAIAQAPPVYSAIKVEGRRAYDRARAGETVAMATREVVIHALDIRHPGGHVRQRSEAVRHPGFRCDDEEGSAAPPAARDPSVRWDDGIKEITLLAHVSKGTYIRSLARDLAHALGTVGHVAMLRRLVAGPFDLAHAISLDKLADLAKARALEDVTLPLTAGLDDIPALPVSPDQARALREGRKLVGGQAHQGLMLAVHGSVPVALVEVSDMAVRVVRGFNLCPDVAKEDCS